MSTFNNANKGALFPREDTSNNKPSYTGPLNVFLTKKQIEKYSRDDGSVSVPMYLAGWVNTPKNNKDIDHYVSLVLSPERETE